MTLQDYVDAYNEADERSRRTAGLVKTEGDPAHLENTRAIFGLIDAAEGGERLQCETGDNSDTPWRINARKIQALGGVDPILGKRV